MQKLGLHKNYTKLNGQYKAKNTHAALLDVLKLYRNSYVRALYETLTFTRDQWIPDDSHCRG